MALTLHQKKRVCEGCGFKRDPSKFDSRVGRLCDKCRQSRPREKRTAEHSRRYYLARYGLTPESYEVIREQQGDRCAICEMPEKLVIDHDNLTGKVRALLCTHCNTGLGMFRDQAKFCARAAEYLLTHRETT